MQLQQQDWTPQQQAIHELRNRYQRGELSFGDYESAFDKLLQAKTMEECQVVLQQLPPSSVYSLLPLEVQSQPQIARLAPTQWIVSLIGDLKRIRHPWKVAEQTTALMGIGDVELDLSLAALPRSATLQVYALIGDVKIYVPRSLHVTVSTTAVLGEASALGQKAEGFIAHSSVERAAEATLDGTAAPYLDIQAHILIGEVRVVQVDNAVLIEKMSKKQGKKHNKKAARLKYEADSLEIPQAE